MDFDFGDGGGISEEAIPAAISAIDNYITEIENSITAGSTQALNAVPEAFKGEYATAINKYIENVFTTVNTALAPVRECRDRLSEALRNYQQKQADLQSTIQTSTENIANNG